MTPHNHATERIGSLIHGHRTTLRGSGLASAYALAYTLAAAADTGPGWVVGWACARAALAGQPGWSVGGGVSGPGIRMAPCPGCVKAARSDFPGLPVAGMREASDPIAAAIGTEVYGHSFDVPALRAERDRMRDAREAARSGR